MRAGQKGHYKNGCFMGHRDAPDGLYPLLRKEVERHILQYGVNRFFVGTYGNFDRMVVDASDYVIAYVYRVSNGAYQTWKYARLREQRGLLCINNLAEF